MKFTDRWGSEVIIPTNQQIEIRQFESGMVFLVVPEKGPVWVNGTVDEVKAELSARNIPHCRSSEFLD